MEKAIMYVRRSTDMQEASLGDQRAAIQDYALRNNFRVVREFCDDAISGKTAEARQGFQDMVEFAKNGNGAGHTLLVYDVSRFGRFENPKEATYWEVELERNGVGVHYVAEGFKNDGSLGSTITKFVKDAEASEYIKKISKTTKRGIRSARQRGYWTSSKAPYGFARALIEPSTGEVERVLGKGDRCVRGKRLKLVAGEDEQVEAIKKIFDLYANHEQGLMSVVQYLNQEEIPNPSGKKHWHKSTVHNILRNPVYTGAIARRVGSEFDILAEDAHKALVDEKTFAKAQERLERMQFGRSGGHTTPYILTSLVECEPCGNNLHGATDRTKNRRGYRCAGYTTKGKDVCDSPYYTAKFLEDPVEEYIKSQVMSQEWDSLVDKAASHALGEDKRTLDGKLEAASSEYTQNQSRSENLLGAIADGLPRKTAITAIEKLEERQEELEDLITMLESKQQAGSRYQHVASNLRTLPNEWDERYAQATPQEKKKLVTLFLAKASINHEERAITYNFFEYPNITNNEHEPPNTIEMKHDIERKKKQKEI